MNRRIKKKRKCLNGKSYRFKNYHERRVWFRIQRPWIVQCLLYMDTWIYKRNGKLIVVPATSKTVCEHYRRCLKYRITIQEEIERFKEEK